MPCVSLKAWLWKLLWQPNKWLPAQIHVYDKDLKVFLQGFVCSWKYGIFNIWTLVWVLPIQSNTFLTVTRAALFCVGWGIPRDICVQTYLLIKIIKAYFHVIQCCRQSWEESSFVNALKKWVSTFGLPRVYKPIDGDIKLSDDVKTGNGIRYASDTHKHQRERTKARTCTDKTLSVPKSKVFVQVL